MPIADIAQLHALQAAAELSATVNARDKVQYEAQAISKAQLDADAADLKAKRAQAAAQAAMVAKKTLRAPFAGRLGITTVNPGQYLNTGDKVVTLQALDPIFVDFKLPQQQLARISVGQTVTLTTDAFSGASFVGKINAIDPRVDPSTRNFQAEATLENPDHQLRPGMFARVAVATGAMQRYLTLPQTAVTYNPYGTTVFIAQKKEGADRTLVAQQAFVTLGPTRGDQVAVLKRYQAGRSRGHERAAEAYQRHASRGRQQECAAQRRASCAAGRVRPAPMKFTDLFVERPVLSLVVSLLILILGLRAIFQLPVSQYPETENAVVTIETAYYGADASTVAGFITQPLEAAISQAQGIEYLSSSSSTGVSVITATLRLNYDSNRALTEINTKVASVRNQLPPQAQQPVLTVQVGQSTDAMYIGYFSDTLATNGLTDYLSRVVKPKLDAVDGVQTAEILGARQFALRAWLDPERMAAHGVAANDVYAALAANNYLTAVGTTKGQMVSVDLTASTDVHSVEEFRRLVVRQQNDAIVRLEDVATVVLGAETYDFSVAFNGKRSVFIGIKVAPKANILDAARRVRNTLPAIGAQLPTGVIQTLVYDATKFINTSINEVIKTLVEALLIVTVVIYPVPRQPARRRRARWWPCRCR